MSDFSAEMAKIVGTTAGGLVSGYFLKWGEERLKAHVKANDLWTTQIQSHWSPFLQAAQELRARFVELTSVYLDKEPILPFTGASLSADFRELFALSRDPIPQENYQLENYDANSPRRDETKVQWVRMRVCKQLTYAESSLYMTVKYLGTAERVRRDLGGRLLGVPPGAREEMMKLLSGVRNALQGETGAGIYHEQQEYIGETVWDASGRVITNLEFRKRLFDLPGWEPFYNLLRFFVEFGPKVEYEVAETIQALKVLEEQVNKLCSCPDGRAYEALWHHRPQGIGPDGSHRSPGWRSLFGMRRHPGTPPVLAGLSRMLGRRK